MKYRKKPVVIEAVQWLGTGKSEHAVMAFTGGVAKRSTSQHDTPVFEITTLEGTMVAVVGDWIIRGIKGELYPCKPDIFEATYEAVEP